MYLIETSQANYALGSAARVVQYQNRHEYGYYLSMPAWVPMCPLRLYSFITAMGAFYSFMTAREAFYSFITARGPFMALSLARRSFMNFSLL